MAFMAARPVRFGRFAAFVSRSGYTGEDGFEISLPADEVGGLRAPAARRPRRGADRPRRARFAAARGGPCLYGHELDETIDPIEAGLAWSIQKRRRLEGGFPGAARVQAALADGPARQRVGLRPDGRAPARDGAEIVDAVGAALGRVTSGGFGPSVGGADRHGLRRQRRGRAGNAARR